MWLGCTLMCATMALTYLNSTHRWPLMLDLFTKKLSPLTAWGITSIMLAFLFGCVPSPVQAAELTVGVFAHEFSFSALISAYNNDGVAEFLIQWLIERISDNPFLSLMFMGLTVFTPFLGFIASRTKNPIDNMILILLNKILHTLSYSTSDNQPDVLSWREMLTNWPASWPSLIEVKTLTGIVAMQDRLYDQARARLDR